MNSVMQLYLKIQILDQELEIGAFDILHRKHQFGRQYI